MLDRYLGWSEALLRRLGTVDVIGFVEAGKWPMISGELGNGLVRLGGLGFSELPLWEACCIAVELDTTPQIELSHNSLYPVRYLNEPLLEGPAESPCATNFGVTLHSRVYHSCYYYVTLLNDSCSEPRLKHSLKKVAKAIHTLSKMSLSSIALLLVQIKVWLFPPCTGSRKGRIQ